MHKPFSAACENNKAPILEVLRRFLPAHGELLEIGAGTGQHAVHFAAALPGLRWRPSDRAGNLPGIEAWRLGAGLENLYPAVPLDVDDWPWPVHRADAVYSANTAHIMGWSSVECMLNGVGRILVSGGVFALYGPFNEDGRHTSASNAEFDQWLRARDPASGIRDRQMLIDCAADAGMQLIADAPMPANNRTLVWRKLD